MSLNTEDLSQALDAFADNSGVQVQISTFGCTHAARQYLLQGEAERVALQDGALAVNYHWLARQTSSGWIPEHQLEYRFETPLICTGQCLVCQTISLSVWSRSDQHSLRIEAPTKTENYRSPENSTSQLSVFKKKHINAVNSTYYELSPPSP